MILVCGGMIMGIWKLHGGDRLYGEVTIQGAKNAALPILSAALVTGCVTTLENVPRLRDVENTLRILECLDCRVERDGNRVTVDSRPARLNPVPPELMTRMRSSVLFLGAMTARFGAGCVSMPGGCMLGPRPVDLHLRALETLGGEITVTDETIACRAPRLRGGHIHFPTPSVGATENALLAACAAAGETVITGAAREPEIGDLQNFLRAMGTEITGAGTDTVRIRGMTPREEVTYSVMPDRIAGATILCAAAACGGDVTVRQVVPEHLDTVTDALFSMGCGIQTGRNTVRLTSDGCLRSPGVIETRPYPGFPTDAQPVLLAACLKAEGVTEFRETIFSGRLRHTRELMKLGADIRVDDRTALVTGVPVLTGAAVTAMDLRGGAALIVAGLTAEGETEIVDRDLITRGYEHLDRILRALGADITYSD